MRTLVLLIAVVLTALGQRHKMEEVNSEKPEGKLLQQIMQENDPAKKATLLEQFATQFPKDPGAPWVLEQLQGIYVKANDPDKTLAAGGQLLALDPDDPEAALQCLKAAESKKDLALIKKYSAAASAAARKMASTPQPKEADQVAAWKGEVDYAKQVANYADYALYRVALESRDPKVVIDVASELRDRDPKGEYAAKVAQPLFVAYRQTGDNAKAVALAEQLLATDQSNEDMLRSVTTDSHGTLYLGGGSKGIVYRGTDRGGFSAMFDSSLDEITDMVASDSGDTPDSPRIDTVDGKTVRAHE